MSELYVLRDLSQSRWAKPLMGLERALVRGDREKTGRAYQKLYHALLLCGAKSLGDAAVSDLLSLETPLSELAMRGTPLPEGLKAGVLLDLERFAALVLRDWQGELSRLLDRTLPPLTALRGPADEDFSAAFEAPFVKSLEGGAWEEALALLERYYRRHGAGSLARFEAFRWVDGGLKGIDHPAKPELVRLIGLERQLARLQANTEAFLAGLPAHHALLYGPRGSGKSTAVRALLPPYSAQGLRLIELHPQDMADMVSVMECLRGRPHAYVLFVDDLSFEDHSGYGPLKTLLEGSLTERPENVLVYA
nr:ATP-binding protein [Deinococcota bacterium]